ncbi:MAG TPA: SusD/RagB family nutrient-binding outer membrane lipoprotein [Chryseolinea sp.]|nr:SusD/RagB family nutrient-binding outer membrane lipoprotein [Chryseolinea sp.]
MKKILKIAKKPLIALLVLLSAAGCSDFLDINTDPNNPLDSRLDQILPTVQTVIFEGLGNGSGGMSDLTSQYVHHTVQRVNSNFYFFAGNEFNIASAWPNLYAGALMDLNVMVNKATERESWHYLGIAQILKAYTYSQMIDLWGKVAYYEFGQGTAAPFAAYDEGAVVYPELLNLLKEAVVNLEKDVEETPGGDDLIYGGATIRWIKLANSIRLKLYNNVRKTAMYDAAEVADIINNQDVISSMDDGFRLLYGTSNNPDNRHPLFKQDYVDNAPNYIDPYFYLIMKGDPSLPEFNPILSGIEDPRVPYYFYNQLAGDDPQNLTTSAYWGDFLSIWFASLNIDPNEGFDQTQSQTVVGLYPCGGAFDDGSGTTAGVGAGQNPGLGGEGYARLYPYLAHLYTRAELSLMSGAPGDHRALFEQAMRASFDEVNNMGADPVPNEDAYITAVMALYDAGSTQKKLELILTEKWIASFGFSLDSYTDYRRTGYPVMFDPNTDGNPFTILGRSYPVSIPYFVDDLQINPNAAPQRNPGTDKIFWDVD